MNKLETFLKKKPIFRTSDAESIGINRVSLAQAVHNGQIERVAYGVYMDSNAFEDNMYILQLRKEKIIFSHATALFLHDLTTRNPLSYEVTVPQGYNTKTLISIGCKVHSVKPDLYGLGIEEVKSSFGNTLRIYNVERTLCDMVRDKKKQDAFVYAEGLKEYASLHVKDLVKLTTYAKILGVEKKIRAYMEVLL